MVEWYDVAELIYMTWDKDRTYEIYGCIHDINEINDNGIISGGIQLDRELRNTVNTRSLFRFSDGKHSDVLKFNEEIRQLRLRSNEFRDVVSSVLFNIAKLGIGGN